MVRIGTLYSHDIRAASARPTTKPAAAGSATGCSHILVTPASERTMNTHLGAAQDLTPEDIDAAAILASSIIYLEGYLWDPDSAAASFMKCLEDCPCALTSAGLH